MPLMKSTITILVLLGILGVAFFLYRFSSQQSPYKGGDDSSMTVEDMRRIDVAPESSLPEHDVILPNGERLDDYANRRGITATSSLP